MLQYLHVIPADGIVLRPGVFSYGRLVHEAFDTNVLMLLQMLFRSTCSLADVHLSAGARYSIDHICLLLHREGERMEGGSGPEHCSDVEVLTHHPDLLRDFPKCRYLSVYVCLPGIDAGTCTLGFIIQVM